MKLDSCCCWCRSMLTYLARVRLLVACRHNAATSLMAILLNNKLSLSILLVDDGALSRLSRVLVLCERSELGLLVLCSEVRILYILNGA